MADAAYYLSAVLGRDRNSLEVRTTVFSPANLDAVLEKGPAAITVAPPGTLAADRLLDIFYEETVQLSGPLPVQTQVGQPRWQFYEQQSAEQNLHLVRSIDSDDMILRITESRRDHGTMAAFIRTTNYDDVLSAAIEKAISQAIVRPSELKAFDARRENSDAANRTAVHAARRRMMDRVGTFDSEDLASGLDSTTRNASQCAADQRKAGKVFGVRFGREWRYPKFQFDASRRPFPEMKLVLAALAPDERGWDRLQWFLEPRECLNGQIPLNVWAQDRAQVIAAANMERWDARD